MGRPARVAVGGALFLIAIAIVGVPGPAGAAGTLQLHVNTAADVVDGDDGRLSLREAIDAANANDGPTLITLPEVTLSVGSCGVDDESNAVGDLDYVGPGPLVLDGRPGTVLRAGCPTQGVLEVTTEATMVLRDLTVTGVDTADEWVDAPVRSLGDVELQHVRLEGNRIGGGDASGLWAAGDVTIQDSAIAANEVVHASNGGAVVAGGGVIIERSEVRDNRSGGGWSAGVRADGDISVIGSVVVGNEAFEDAEGGAISAAGDLSVVSSEVRGNRGEGPGGALNAGADLVIDDSVLTGNEAFEAEPFGGADHAAGGAGYGTASVTVTDSVLRGNEAHLGGALASIGNPGVVDISRSELIENHAMNGGGVWAQVVRIRDSLAEGNQAEGGFGGALSGVGASASEPFSIQRSTFVRNHSAVGGAVLTQGGADIADSTFSANEATALGGATYFDGPPVSVARSTFVGNAAPQSASISADEGGLALTEVVFGDASGSEHCTFFSPVAGDRNVADDDSCLTSGGGDVVVPDVGLSPLADDGFGTFVHQPAAGSPVIDVVSTAACATGATDQRGVARPRGAGCDAGAVEWAPPLVVTTADDVVDDDDGVLSLREAVSAAAAVEGPDEIELLPDAEDGAELTIGSGCAVDEDANAGGDVDHNPAVGTDGLHVRSPNPGAESRVVRGTCSGERVLDQLGAGPLVLSGVEITGGTAGGVRAVGPVTLRHAALVGNSSVDAGGGLLTPGDVRLEDSQVVGNTSDRYGGGIHSGGLDVVDSVIEGNHARENGGGAFAADLTTVVDSEISANTTDDGGAGLYVDGWDQTIRTSQVVGTVISGNSARWFGGGVSGRFELVDVDLVDNEAGRSGAGAQMVGTVTGSRISDNVVTTTGFGLAHGAGIAGSDLTVVDSVLSGNAITGTGEGSGAGVWGDLLRLVGSTVVENTVEHGWGGGLGGYDISVERSTVTGNSAEFAGGIGIGANYRAEVFDSTVVGNSMTSTEIGLHDGNLGVEGGGANTRDFTVRRSIVAGSTGPTCVIPRFVITDSVVDDDACVAPTPDAGNVVAPGEVSFGPLGDNGGPTPTLLPAGGSPVIDHVDPSRCPAGVDQRGLPRPRGERCDAGAVEVQTEQPSRPRNLTAVPGLRRVELSWEAPVDPGSSPVTGYTVRRDGEVLVEVGAEVLAHVDEGLVNGRRYDYEVVAHNAQGTSVSAGPVSGVPVADPIPPHGFTDVPVGHWAFDGVSWAGHHQIVAGFADGSFRSAASVTRAQAAQWLWLTMDQPDGERRAFADVPPSQWAFDAIGWAGEAGVVTGLADGSFGPSADVTRAQWASMLWNIAGRPEPVTPSGFPDTPLWAADAVAWADEHEILNGFRDGTVRPAEALTRGQAVMSLHAFLSTPDGWSSSVTPPSTRTF